VLDLLLPAPPSAVPETGGTSVRQGDQTAPVEATLPRRRFLARSGGTFAGALAVGLVSRQLLDRRNVAAPRAQVRLPSPPSPGPLAPANADLSVPGLSSFVTPNSAFYRIDTALSVPQVDPRTWRLRIHGRVRNTVTITYEQLLAMPTVERYITLTCVSNEVGGTLIGNARWLGVSVKPLLERAGPLPGADQVVGRSVDGFTVGTPTDVLLDGRDALLAIGMNGQPLPTEHGFPVRMVVPGLYGYVSATKWITELELTSFADYSAYWIPQGWAARAPIKTESRIDTPRDGSSPRAGTVMVAGVAWAQHRGIAKVEVRVDGGEWQVATLGQVPSVDTWRQWSWTWHASPGTHRIEVRATDNDSQSQTAAMAPPEPDGATGWHTIEVSVR
jgi:DMSO/TMAO reductase YedYZ molybdopterin-dependent catalytic subunit